jgi:GNAT superfamily N-acetyltransferase
MTRKGMITLRPATPTDVEAIASLLAEVDRYYGAGEEPVAERLPVIHEAIFGDRPSAHVLLAVDGARPIGLAAYSFLWPAAGVTRSLFLKELYVFEAHRQQGVGHLIMGELCRIARDSDCSRVEWAADTDNPIALNFYAALGVPPDSSKHLYRLDHDAIAQMAASAGAGAGRT